MPAPKSKGKRKGKKGKKGKKKETVIPQPLPLHILTELYTKVDALVRQLINGRVVARKKRKEAEFLDREQESLKRDGAVYREHLNDLLLDVQKGLLDMRILIDKERESIAKEILKVQAELQKKLEQTFKLIEERQRTLEQLQKSLRDLQPLRDMVTKTMKKLEEIMAEYNRLRIEVLIKTTHLRNQYLNFRADLYNYLYEQLLSLVTTVRAHLIPILWDHMEKLSRENRCHRWELLQIDEKNFKLLEARNKLLKKVEALDGEEQYYGMEWAFVRLNELNAQSKIEKLRWKNRLKEIFKNRNLTQFYKMKEVVAHEVPTCKVVVDFREFLQKKLQAIAESKERQERIERQREIKKRRQLIEKKKSVASQKRAPATIHHHRQSPPREEDFVLHLKGSATSVSKVTSSVETSVDTYDEYEQAGLLMSEMSLMSVQSNKRESIKPRSSTSQNEQENRKKSDARRLTIVHEEEEE